MIEISGIETFCECKAHSSPVQIDKINCNDLTYDVFHQKYMHQNVPLVIESVPQKWKSMQTWIKSDGIDFDHLRETLPNHKVPIADCSKQHLNSHEKFEMNLHDFLDYWSTEPNCDNKLWYLKDWHLRKGQPSYDFYNIPQYFASDWLNEYLHGSEQDDYKFVYMGPKGTWTPFHVDVFQSFSWSTNIFGIKKWILVHPNEERKLLDNLNNLPFAITEEMLQKTGCAYICLLQKAGDTIFVPSGWYHQVHNIEDTISINHNFFNGCNVLHVWSALQENYQKVVIEISDCRDMDNFEGHCQIMLKALHGMNFEDFFDLLKVIVDNRIQRHRRTGDQLPINEFAIGENLCLFDLKSCLSVLDKVERSHKELNFGVEIWDACNQLSSAINEELKNYID
ncbi:2-oxoglutarate and iron-dependent oxygenase JMJD4 homolog [Bradysia coprophila]|uniref:2-oxoglutarate and iron-dependent oxygenase JMJD4 homolog n=1 Tax=Bradysia coprophila TaxID=38358 RepID=UPI00187DA090|nr:2-oxoglutarate and iron-dependent oxygenase JMJD4 homolog [Bradysia coprophila]